MSGSPKPQKVSARDPETGQFVSGVGGGTIYRDHEVQHIRATARDNGSGPNAATSIEDVVEVDPPADRRQEEAEVVALNVHYIRAEIDIEEAIASGEGIRAGWEISRDEDLGPLTQFRNEVDISDNAVEGDDLSAQALSRQFIDDSNDVLWFSHVRGSAGGAGRVNALGGPYYIDYRRMLGGGPVFTGGDTLHFHTRWNRVQNEENFVTDIGCSVYWDVRDRD